MIPCVALVVAAGRGRRVGGEVPKQYQPLDGAPLLRRTLGAFLSHPAVDRVRAVIHPDDGALFETASRGLDVMDPVTGGATRQDSVRLGLESLESLRPGRVLIHDAARPFVDAATIFRVLEALDTHPGAIPALPVSDTLKRGEDGLVGGTVERDGLWRAQTPQGFRFADILAAHRRAAGSALTDDAAVAEAAGLEVALVAGSADNLKITTDEDLRRAQGHDEGGSQTRTGQTRSGMGFDVHRFGPGDHVMLCGIAVPHGFGLEGHSDADVALHAITDAVLGAIGAGDIGTHFPPGEAQWKDAPSSLFLEKAAELVSGMGGAIANVDVTVICEAPRIGPHRAAMTARLAEILGLAEDRVSVKGTTSEGLGFTGRGEGIAAQAIATVRFP